MVLYAVKVLLLGCWQSSQLHEFPWGCPLQRIWAAWRISTDTAVSNAGKWPSSCCFQGTSGNLFHSPPSTSQQSNAASCMFSCVKGCDCKIANSCLAWKGLPVQFSKAFCEGRSLVFHGQRCSHVVLCSCLIECSWGNSLVDFLIMSPLLSSPWFCLVLIFIHCCGYAVFIFPESLYIFRNFDLSCIFAVLLTLSLLRLSLSLSSHSFMWKHRSLAISILMQASWAHREGLKSIPFPLR